MFKTESLVISKEPLLGGSDSTGMSYQEDDNMVARLVSILKTYEGGSREMLSYMLGCSDRTLRATVTKARRKGHPICSSSDNKGYRLGYGEEYEHTIRDLRSRAKELNMTADAMEQMRKGSDVQLCMEGFEQWQRN